MTAEYNLKDLANFTANDNQISLLTFLLGLAEKTKDLEEMKEWLKQLRYTREEYLTHVFLENRP